MYLENIDGIVESLYYFLWTKDNCVSKQTTVLIPHTIIIQNHLPTVWYFVDRNQQICLKRQDKLTFPNIIQTFTKKVGASQVAAIYIYNKQYDKDHNFSIPNIPRSQSIEKAKITSSNFKYCIDYITIDKLESFLNSKNKANHGILQQFLDPNGQNETMIRVIWSPSIQIIEKRQNQKVITDLQYDPYERCITFDGAPFYSQYVQMKSQIAGQCLREMATQIVNKICNQSFEKYLIKRAIFYFKPNKDNIFHFLFCTSIRTSEEKQLIQNKKHKNTPLQIGSNLVKSDKLKKNYTINTLRPILIMMDNQCLNCDQLCQIEDLMNVSFKWIIEYFYKFQNKDMNMKSSFNLNNHKQVIVEQPDDAKMPLLTSRVFQDKHNISNNFELDSKNMKYMKNIRDSLPPLILKFYPDMNQEIFNQLRYHDQFLRKQMKLCMDCYLLFSKTMDEQNNKQINLNNHQKALFNKQIYVKSKSASLKRKNQSQISLHNSFKRNASLYEQLIRKKQGNTSLQKEKSFKNIIKILQDQDLMEEQQEQIKIVKQEKQIAKLI